MTAATLAAISTTTFLRKTSDAAAGADAEDAAVYAASSDSAEEGAADAAAGAENAAADSQALRFLIQKNPPVGKKPGVDFINSEKTTIFYLQVNINIL